MIFESNFNPVSHFEKSILQFSKISTVKFSEKLSKFVLDDFRNIDRFRFLILFPDLILLKSNPKWNSASNDTFIVPKFAFLTQNRPIFLPPKFLKFCLRLGFFWARVLFHEGVRRQIRLRGLVLRFCLYAPFWKRLIT